MRTRAITVPRPPATMLFALLAVFFLSLLFAASARAQSADPSTVQALNRLATAVEGLVGQRQAQAQPASAPAPVPVPAPVSVPTATVCNYADPNFQAVCELALRAHKRADYAVEVGEHNTARYNELAPVVQQNARDIRALKRNSHAPATASATTAQPNKPATPGTTGSVASVNSTGHAPDLKPATADPEFRRRAIRFAGFVPNAADVAAVKALVDGGRYEFASTTPVTWLPAPGQTQQERDLARSGRDTNLGKAYGAGLNGRIPADPEELAELQRSAPAGTGAIVHLKKK